MGRFFIPWSSAAGLAGLSGSGCSSDVKAGMISNLSEGISLLTPSGLWVEVFPSLMLPTPIISQPIESACIIVEELD